MTPLVSILIPAFNASSSIAETLDSALSQTHPRCEIIVVDDGSRDETLIQAKKFSERGVQVVSQKNSGAAAARNHALRLSRGEFIQYLDADDLLAPDKIAIQLTRAKSEKPDTLLTARWGRFTDDPAKIYFHNENPLFADLSPRDFMLLHATYDCMMHPAAWLVPRSISDATGPWDEQLSLNDDGDYFTRAVTHAEHIAWCPDALSYYRSELSGSLSSQRSRKHLESAHRVVLNTAQHMLSTEDTSEYRSAIADLFQRFAYDYYPAAPDLIADVEKRARDLGGATYSPRGGKFFQLARHLIGWKLARRLQVMTGRFSA